jgi:membrane protein
MPILRQAFARLSGVWKNDIWVAATSRDKTLRTRLYAVLRVFSITVSGLRDIHVAIRATALSYSSLLSLGPIVAIAVLISGLTLGNKDPAIIAAGVSRILGVIAPQVDQFDRADPTSPSIHFSHDAPPPTEVKPLTQTPASPELVKLVESLVTHSRSGAAGVIGGLTLLVIVVQLFTTIENTFNDIWGVRRGRSWLARIVYYWSVITFGALLFVISLTLLSAGAFMSVFLAKLPMGAQLKSFIAWMLPSSSFLLLFLVLALFYRLIPNTRVRWTAALAGALVVTGLLFLNNYLAFLYFRQVVFQKSLYGSVSILFVLMLGLYIFWFFVLVGGQLTYAIQNVEQRSSLAAWHTINQFTREGLSLLVLLLVARHFKSCQPPFSVSGLARHIRVPSQILNESLNRLCDLELIVQLPSDDSRDQMDYRYQPARPLDKITLHDFKQLFEQHGNTPHGEVLDRVDPVLAYYHEKLAVCLPEALGQKSLNELLDELPLNESRVPFPIRP